MAFDFLKKVGNFIQAVVPGREVARGLGIGLALPGVYEIQRKGAKRDKEFQDFLITEFNKTTDSNKKEILRKAMLDFKPTNSLGEAIKDAPTTRQTLASAAELALFASIGVKTPLPKAKALKIGVIAAREAAIGAGFFGLTKAQEKDATTDDIIRNMEIGAVVGVGAYGASLGVGKVIQATGKKIISPLTKKAGKVFEKIEQKAVAEPVAKGNTQIEKTLSLIGEDIKTKTAQRIVSVQKGLSKTKARILDRFSPIQRIESKLSEKVQRPLKEYEKLYRDARELTSASDYKAENLLAKFDNELSKYKSVEKEATAYLTQLDLIDRAKLGQKVAGNQSMKELFVGLRKIINEIGPQKMGSVIKYKDTVSSFQGALLKARVDSGLISKEVADVLRRTHPNYIPHDVLLGIDERSVMGLSQSLNVPKTDIMKAVGSSKKITNPLSATISRTQIAARTINKNKLLNNLVKVQEKNNIIPGMKKLISGAGPQTNFETINLFRNGIKETWQVPMDLAYSIKNLDAPLMPGWFNVLTYPQTILKKFATQLNLSFAIPNKFRDKQTAYLTAGSFIEDISKKYGLIKNPINIAKFSNKEIQELYSISGGYGASIFKEGESKILQGMQKTGVSKVLSSSNPAKLINTINDTIEQSTRIGVFKKALEAGLNAKDAALVARDATIDFAKMGSWMQPLNKAIPFLNARVQGFINLPRALANSPETFTRMQMLTAVYPTLLLHQYNRRFESYKNISDYFKSKYWIIMTGEQTSRDPYNGNEIMVPQFITIPKGEGQTLVSGPLQYYLEKADGTDYRKVSEMIADVVGSSSPLEFQTFNQGNLWLSLAAQMGPAVSIPAGYAAGKVPYTGTKITPPGTEKAEDYLKYRETTPEILKDVGKIANISPSNMEFFIESWGGLSQDMLSVVDTIYGVVRGNEIGGNPLTETLFGKATQLPVLRRVMRETGEFGSPEMEYRTKQKEEIEKDVETKRVLLQKRAVEIFEEMNKKETYDEKLNYLNSLGDELTQELRDKISTIKSYRQSIGVLKPTDSVELRARYIQMMLDEMIENGISFEDRVEYLNQLEEGSILTKNVKEFMSLLQK